MTISRHLVDPEIIGIAESFPPQLLSDETIVQARTVPLALDFTLAEGVACSEHVVPGPEGTPDRRLLVLGPADVDAKAPCLFFIHGGGYVLGNPESVQSWASSVAKACRCLVILPTYRLAPEGRWPAPVDDLYAQLNWAHANASVLGIDPAKIAIGGASAGGGHAARLALHARDEGGPAILYQLLLAPMIDDRHPENPYAGAYVWTRDYDRYGWDALLGMETGGDGVPPAAVPNRVQDFANLPPTYIGIGDLDLFTDACLDFARRLMANGVSTELHVFAGGFHGFEYFAPEAAISKLLLSEIPRALSAAFSRA
jgi:acetyl esterase/lipase